MEGLSDNVKVMGLAPLPLTVIAEKRRAKEG